MGAREACNFTGVILAGGRSSRMGIDKASIQYRGSSLLDRARAKLLAIGAEEIVILGRPEEIDGVADNIPHQGPAAALCDYLRGTEPDTFHLIVPVDMPLLSPGILAKLTAAEGWAHYEDAILPLFAGNTGQAIPNFKRLRDIAAFMKAKELPVLPEQASQFQNINYPEDLAALSNNISSKESLCHA